MKKTESILGNCLKPVGGAARPNSWLKLPALFMAVFAVSFLATTAQAQTTIRPFQWRFEVPVGTNGVLYFTNNVMRVATNGAGLVPDGTATNWLIPSVNVSISGAPAGVTATLVDYSFNTVGTIPVTLNTNSGSKNTNLVVKLAFDGTQAAGASTLMINLIGGVTNGYFPLILDVGKIWNGSAPVGVNGTATWSDSTKWYGGVPGVGDAVVFSDVGSQTNILNTQATSTNSLFTSIVDVSKVISSLRFGATNGTAVTGAPLTNWQNLFINPGVTLALNGPGGFSMLRDYSYWTVKMNVTISGTNGVLIQTNENSSFAMLVDGQGSIPDSVLDMSALGKLQLNVNTINIGDILNYPNYSYFITNGYTPGSTLGGSRPSKCIPNWKMALTNDARVVYVDPFNYTNSLARTYALEIGRNETTGGSSGNYGVSMGLTNSFKLDGLCVAGYASLGGLLNFWGSNSFAMFRNTNGGRMSVFTCGDAAGFSSVAPVGNNTKCGNAGFGVDFTRNTVDALVDRFYMAMDRGYTTGDGVCQASFGMSGGVFDANSAFIGYQASGNQTNQDSCTGSLTVTNTGVFRVNGTLALGYTTASFNDASKPGSTKGTVTIGPGGTLMASNISVGGVTKASTGNAISLVGNATLVVSNSIADATPNGALGSLSFTIGNNAVKLFINGLNPSPLIFVTNFTASGVGNKLIIGSVTNLTYPADVVIMQGVSAATVSAASFDAGVVMPAGLGLSGTLATLNSGGSNAIVLHIINRVGNKLVWRGSGSTAAWDYTTTNWVNQTNGQLITYDNPDTVAFDNLAAASNVTISATAPFTPAAINMTNSGYYTFLDGGNQISGGPSFNKYGAGVVEIDANTTVTLQLNQGTLAGFPPGIIGNANVASGAVMNYSGDISGSLASAGTATTGGTITGTLTVQSGGIVTNSGTVNNIASVLNGGFLYNAGTFNSIGSGTVSLPTVSSNATMVNNGTVNGDVLFVNGTYKDLGGSANSSLTALQFGPNSTYIPGGDGIGTSTVGSDGSGSFPGALLLALGSTTILKVDAGIPQNTAAAELHLSFGASASQQTQNGTTLVITNVGVTPFNTNQSYQFFVNTAGGGVPFSTGTSTNTFPLISPASPGPGLAWDLTKLWSQGSISIVSAASGPALTNSFALVGGTNIVANFSWDPAYTGYRLQTQNNPLSIGLSTNWTGVVNSWSNNVVTLTNSVSASSTVFFRLVYP